MTTVNDKKRIIGRTVIMLALMVLTATTAWADQTDEWIYTPYPANGTCVITGSIENPQHPDAEIAIMTIPKQLGGYWVVDVNDGVLSGFTGLKTLTFYEDAKIEHMPKVYSGTNFSKVCLIKTDGTRVDNVLPASMTDIGNAFRGTRIKNLTMPSVTSIGASAFEGCNSLTSVTFGQAAPIGVYGYETPFSKISSSCTVTYPGPMSNWSAYNFQYSPNLVVNCSDGSCGWCGDGWEDDWTNENNLYRNNSCLYWMLSSDGELTIDCLAQDIVLDNYFSSQIVKTNSWDKSKVTSLKLKRVYGIVWGIFPNLTSVSISKSVEKISINNLTSLPSLTTIVVDADNPTYDSRDGCNAVIEKYYVVLTLGSGGTSIIPDGVSIIGESAFRGCLTLTSVTIPSSVGVIKENAFLKCNNLRNLYYNGTKTQWDAVEKGNHWNFNHYSYSDLKEHWRCTVTFDANGRGTAPAAQENLWSNEAKATEPEAPTSEGWRVMGWYTDAACTTPWNFDTDIVPGDMTLYAKWVEPCAVTALASATNIDIPYGQEWTDIPVTVNSLTLGWFQNGTDPARVADAVAVTPMLGGGAGSSLTFSDNNAATLIARRGAGAHTNISALSESLTAAGQSGTLWVHIPAEVWKSATPGNYSTYLYYDAVFVSGDPAETYTYSLGSGAKMLLSLTIPEAVTLSFNANGGTGTMDVVSGPKDTDMQLPACTITAPAGKDFLCWNSKADGTGTRYYVGTPYQFGENQTLYAEWGEGYVLDLTATAVGASVAIPLGLSAQLTQLTGYFNNEGDPMGLDVNLDGEKDLALVQEYDPSGATASVTKLTSLTENYRFVLSVPTEEGEYGSVLIKFVSGNSAVEPGIIEQLFDNNGTYNSGQLLVLKDGQPHNLMLSGRTIYTDGDWNTLCLPFDIDNFNGTPLEGFTVKELDTETAYSGHVTGIEGSTLYLNFKDATRIEAGKPYIVKQSGLANLVNPVFTGVTVTTATAEVPNPFRVSYEDPEFITVAVPTDVAFTGGKFCGSYDPVSFTANDESILFLGAANKLHWPNAANNADGKYHLNACRAYFQLADGQSAREFVLDFGDHEIATGISTTDLTFATPHSDKSENFTNSDTWFTIDGRKLQGKPTTKGLYIHNGHKVVMK